MGVRRLSDLVVNLPRGCALHRAQDPDERAGWTPDVEMLANVLELLDRHDRHFVVANSKKGTAKPKALKVPRPRDLEKRARRRPVTGDELAAMIRPLGGAVVASKEGGGNG